MEKIKKILTEMMFVIAPVAISLLLFRLIRNFPIHPYVSIVGSLVSLLLIASLFFESGF